jgi:hypothetical protein
MSDQVSLHTYHYIITLAYVRHIIYIV